MSHPVIRYQHNPILTDTVGFFDYCIPLTNDKDYKISDSLLQYYNLSLHNYSEAEPLLVKKKQISSIFVPHKLQASTLKHKPINRQSTDWIIGLLLVCLLFFAWIQTTYSKRLNQIFKAAAQPYFVNQLEREGNLFTERISIGLSIIYYTMTSLFIFLSIKEFGSLPRNISPWLLTLLILGGVFLFEMVKSGLISLSGHIFRTEESSHEIRLNLLIFNHIAGIILFPITIAALFWHSQYFLIFGFALFSLLMLYRLIRLITVGISTSKYNLFYLFLYLCTLEILPLILLLKTVQQL